MFERCQRCQLWSCAVVLTAADISHKVDLLGSAVAICLTIILTHRFGPCLNGTDADARAVAR